MNPRATPAEVRRSAQSLWGGVHGITVLALTGKLAIGGDAPSEVLTNELIGRYLDGMVDVDRSNGLASTSPLR